MKNKEVIRKCSPCISARRNSNALQKMPTLCAHCPLLVASHKKSELKHGKPNPKNFRSLLFITNF
jgi:hypothetical protein